MVHMMIPVIFSIFVAILCAHHHTVYGQFPYNINENNNGAVPWWQRSASASVTANNGVSPFIGVYDTHQFALSCRPRPGCCCPQGPIRITAGNGDDKIEVSGTTVGGSACFGQTTLSGSFTQINPKLATYSIKVPIVGDLKFTLTLDASGNTLTLTPSGGSCPTVGYRISGNGSPSSSPTIPSSPYASPGAATSCTPMPTPYGLITPYGCTSPYATSVNPSYGNNGYNGYDGYNYNPYGNNPYSNGVSYNPTADRYSDIASASNQGGPFRPWGAGAGGAGSGAIQGRHRRGW